MILNKINEIIKMFLLEGDKFMPENASEAVPIHVKFLWAIY